MRNRVKFFTETTSSRHLSERSELYRLRLKLKFLLWSIRPRAFWYFLSIQKVHVKKKEYQFFVIFRYLLFFLFVHFFLFDSCTQRERNEPKKEKQRLLKDTVYNFISDFSVTSYCKNHLKIKLCLIKIISGALPPNPL